MKAVLAGLGTGLCLMSLIAAVDDKDQWSWEAFGVGVGLGLVTFSIVQEIEDRRTYWLLYQSDNKRMKMLSDHKNLESSLLPIIKENLDKEREVLNGDSDF
ncbi:hypothetical protein [Crocosphaera sp.]|uniref:hypothetical protein n=1 Tax=Crocosphaera sp. TaxID=2729996 RepID=UPI0026122F54|nr:hypothetical protein [Crocosphaera sp.]MDJ0582884.1 hypothetical protein [Crocosphaera sp.]